MPLISLTQFAKEIGKTPAYVTKLRNQGVLNTALVPIKGKKRVKVDLERGLQLYQERMDPNFVKSDITIPKGKNGDKSGTETFVEARTLNEKYKAANNQLNYEIKQGQYIHRSLVEDHAYRAARICRDTILNIGPRVAAILAAEKDEIKILKILDEEHKEAMNELVKQLGMIK